MSEKTANAKKDPASENGDPIDVEEVYSRFHQNCTQYRGIMPVTSSPHLLTLHSSAKLGKCSVPFQCSNFARIDESRVHLEKMVILIHILYWMVKTVTEIITNKCRQQRRKLWTDMLRPYKNIEEHSRNLRKLTAFMSDGASPCLRNRV